jgi:hypothetical protein
MIEIEKPYYGPREKAIHGLIDFFSCVALLASIALFFYLGLRGLVFWAALGIVVAIPFLLHFLFRTKRIRSQEIQNDLKAVQKRNIDYTERDHPKSHNDQNTR